MPSSVRIKMTTGTFIYSSLRTKTLATFIKTYRKAIKTWAVQRTLYRDKYCKKRWLSSCIIGCVRFARYCGIFFPTVDRCSLCKLSL